LGLSLHLAWGIDTFLAVLYRRFTNLANFYLLPPGFLFVKDLHAAPFAYRALTPAAGSLVTN
jgi:hypothetical protein